MRTYQGDDVQTKGEGRYARATIRGRDVWARARRPDAAERAVLGDDPRVEVLGWGASGVLWHDLDAATRATLRGTIGAGA